MSTIVHLVQKPMKAYINNSIADVAPPDDDKELHLVMREVVDALGARGAIITIQCSEDERYDILYCDNAAGIDHAMVRQLLDLGLLVYDEDGREEHRWKHHNFANGDELNLMLLPVRRIPGHDRMVITALFDSLTPEQHKRAEQAYCRHRPFALGYFRLWQFNRNRRRREQGLEAALDAIGFGVMLIDEAGNVVFSNEYAQRLLASKDGLLLHRGALRATNLQDGVRFRTALEHVIGGAAEESAKRVAATLSLGRSAAPALVVSILPLNYKMNESSDVAAMIYVAEPDRLDINHFKPMCKLYKLSLMETTLACLLATGNSLARSAENMRIKEQTARGLLKHIFIKMGVKRQTELVSLMILSLVKISNIYSIEYL